MFQFYPGQPDYLARTLALRELEPGFFPGRIFAAATGCGKTLMAIFAARLLLERDGHFAGRCLIVAPGGTLRAEKPTKTRQADPDDDDGTLEADDTRSQWRKEIARFAPGVPCHELFCWEDYLNLLRPDGSLPTGIFVSYYEAMFRNNAREVLPESWLGRKGEVDALSHDKLCEWFAAESGLPKDLGPLKHEYLIHCPGHDLHEQWAGETALFQYFPFLAPQKTKPQAGQYGRMRIQQVLSTPTECYAEGVGETKAGIRCIIAPCLAERIEFDQRLRRISSGECRAPNSGPESAAATFPHSTLETRHSKLPASSCFDMVELDEAHLTNNLDAQVTQAMVRLQPAYRFALTATPITNLVSGVFCLCGWLSVPQWFAGERRNAAWPYAREDEARFNSTFLTVERDFTQEEMSEKSRKCVKYSPVISAPARLLKLLKPILAYIGKPECNPAYQPPKLTHVRVPLGAQQARAYQHFLNRGNIPGHPLMAARKQVAYLRALCADPQGFKHDGPKTHSNFNPKTIAILTLVAEILARGEQVNIVNARVGQSDELARRLTEAGIPFSRIDSTIPPARHGSEAEKLKSGRVRVQLMGAKCAASHSFSMVKNQIVCSLEFTWGALDQTCGRVDRVNSPPGVNIYIVLHKDTMEEGMFDKVAVKGDAATICLQGKRVPREFQPVDAQEVLAANIVRWQAARRDPKTKIAVRDEAECELDWPTLRTQLQLAVSKFTFPIAPCPPSARPEPPPATEEAPEEEADLLSFPPQNAKKRWVGPAWLQRLPGATPPSLTLV